MNEYVPPTLTIDAVIFQIINDYLSVALIKRRNEPFRGQRALPGGYNPVGETTEQALSRIIKRKAGIDIKQLGLVEQLYTFDAVGRDPRGHAVSVTYMGLSEGIAPSISSSTEDPEFFPVNQLPALAYDHKKIITYAHERLASKITYTNAIYALLPSLFTLAQLQTAYEAIFGYELDKRNFRKKIFELDIVMPTEEFFRAGAHRPARLYKFTTRELKTLDRNFLK